MKILIEFAKRNIGIKTLKKVNKVQVEQATEYLVLQQGIATSTPWAKPSSSANLDYTHECNKAANETQRLRRIHRLTQSEDDWDRYRQARNRKKRTMAAAPRMKRCHHVEEVMINDIAGLWLLIKWARSRDRIYYHKSPILNLANGSKAASQNRKRRRVDSSYSRTTVGRSIQTAFGYRRPIELTDITENEDRLSQPSKSEQNLEDSNINSHARANRDI